MLWFQKAKCPSVRHLIVEIVLGETGKMAFIFTGITLKPSFTTFVKTLLLFKEFKRMKLSEVTGWLHYAFKTQNVMPALLCARSIFLPTPLTELEWGHGLKRGLFQAFSLVFITWYEKLSDLNNIHKTCVWEFLKIYFLSTFYLAYTNSFTPNTFFIRPITKIQNVFDKIFLNIICF